MIVYITSFVNYKKFKYFNQRCLISQNFERIANEKEFFEDVFCKKSNKEKKLAETKIKDCLEEFAEMNFLTKRRNDQIYSGIRRINEIGFLKKEKKLKELIAPEIDEKFKIFKI